MIYFFDASAFIALFLENDQYHRKCKHFFDSLSSQPRFITSNFVLDETINHFNSRLGAETAYRYGEGIMRSPLYEIIDVDRSIFHEGLRLLRKFNDKGFSFTDLTSFAIMRLHRINHVITFDSDFVKAGFQIVPSG